MTTERGREEEEVRGQRWQALAELEDWLELPMAMLGLVWLLLLVIELVRGTNPLFDVIGTIIWVIFIIDFGVRFLLAPSKPAYLRNNVLTVISLALPALRVFRTARALRILRLSRTTRGIRLVRVVTSFRRGMSSLGAAMQRRGLGYAIVLTVLVTLLGAAGVYAFENGTPGVTGYSSYADAVWWTVMLLTSLGSEYWPVTGEARLLTVLLAVYGFAVFGYITASLASFFVSRDAARDESAAEGAGEVSALRAELRALREELAEARQDGPRG